MPPPTAVIPAVGEGEAENHFVSAGLDVPPPLPKNGRQPAHAPLSPNDENGEGSQLPPTFRLVSNTRT
jgi:hypothetical protein